jgi:hypothetical protein
MSGIFYDPTNRRLHAINGSPAEGWRLVTHNLEASPHQCRRIMSEWLSRQDLLAVEFEVRQAGG